MATELTTVTNSLTLDQKQRHVDRAVFYITAVAIVISLLPWLSRWAWCFDVLASFPLQLAVGGLIWSTWLVRLRRPALASTMTAVAILSAAPSFSWCLQPADDCAADKPHLRVVGYNIWARNNDRDDVLRFLREVNPDIAVCCEVRAEMAHRFSTELRALFPHQGHAIREKGQGIVVLSKHPVLSSRVCELPDGGIVANVVISYEGERIRVLGAHPFSPTSTRRWHTRNRQLRELAALAKTMTEPTIVIGDFNTTPWSYFFNRFAEQSCLRDTQRGIGFARTWPRGNPLLQMPIDHAFVSSHWLVKNRDVGRATSSDHLPLVIDLVRVEG
jgi:endonuclease/exonuclease/phosphatase (EEP) superfamily protein YafD